jgi:hypothetical protein
MSITPLPLAGEFLFRAVLSVGAPQAVGATRTGELRIVPVTGGSIEGPALTGEILPGTAADWLRVDPDGTAHMDVRLTIKASTGAIIFMHYSGIRTAKPEVLARLNAGQAVDAAEYYFRTAVRFETGDAGFGWLNKVLAIGIGQRPPSGPTYDVYAVK